MWMSVDRIEGGYVILMDEGEQIYTLSVQDYLAMTGFSPKEAHVLSCVVKDGSIQTAIYDPEETERRLTAAKARLERLGQRAKKK